MTDPIKLCKRCGGCFQRKETGACACPHCGYDEDAEYEEKILSILGVEAPIVLPLNQVMTVIAWFFMIGIVMDGKLGSMFDAVARFFLFSGSERVRDTIDCCMLLTYVDSLVTGWFFQYQFFVRFQDLPIGQLKLLSIIGALNIICAVAAGILIFYILGALELFFAVAFGTLLFYIVRKLL